MSLIGQVSPPMANGEVVFEALWQGRVFGMARALCEQGCYTWDEFRVKLIEEIANAGDEPDDHYFDHFLAALTSLLSDKNLCEPGELHQRTEVLAERPHGHDH